MITRKFFAIIVACIGFISCSNPVEDIDDQDISRDRNEVIRILCMGSSWGINSWYYLPFILKDAGVRFELYGLYRGAIEFNEWGPIFNEGKIDSNLFQLVFVNNGTTTDYKYTTSQGEALNDEIKPNSFDVIFTNNGARSSVDKSSWDTGREVMKDIFDRYAKDDGIVVFNSTWCPSLHGISVLDGNLGTVADNDVPATSYNVADRESQDAFQDINWANTIEWCRDLGIGYIVPNGSLMYILRNHPITNTGGFICPAWHLRPQYVEYTQTQNTELCVDGIHAAAGLPSFALAMNLVYTVFGPMSDIKIEDINWRPASIRNLVQIPPGMPYEPNFIDEGYIYNTTAFEIPLDEQQIKVIIDAIKLAQRNKFNRATLN